MAKQKIISSVGKDHMAAYAKMHKHGNILMRSNPGSVAVIESSRSPLTKTLHFKMIFICFEASKVGFLAGCRPFLGLYGTHLKGPYGGVLLTV